MPLNYCGKRLNVSSLFITASSRPLRYSFHHLWNYPCKIDIGKYEFYPLRNGWAHYELNARSRSQNTLLILMRTIGTGANQTINRPNKPKRNVSNVCIIMFELSHFSHLLRCLFGKYLRIYLKTSNFLPPIYYVLLENVSASVCSIFAIFSGLLQYFH